MIFHKNEDDDGKALAGSRSVAGRTKKELLFEKPKECKGGEEK
jgi:hypothetical protein